MILKFDRTSPTETWSHEDANRIGVAINEIYSLMHARGYLLEPYNARTDYAEGDIIMFAEINKIKAYIDDLQAKVYNVGIICPTVDLLTVKKANDIEKILFLLDEIKKNIDDSYRYCGVVYCG